MINSSEAKEKEAVASSNKEDNASQKLQVEYDNEAGESDMYSSTSTTTSSGHIDASTSSLPLAAPEHTTPVSTTNENKPDGGVEEEDEEDDELDELDELEDDSEPDSGDDLPEFTGGEARGRVVNPYAGPRPPRPTHPQPK